MTGLELGLWSVPVLLAMILLRAPIGLAMLICGLGGTWLLTGRPDMALARLKTEVFGTFSNYTLSVVPVFLLMGHLAGIGGLSRALFGAAEALVGHRRGGTAMAAVGACAGFGAICGSSLATAATMGRVALPELRAAGYEGGLSTAALAAGGTLGVLIPPSIVLVIYASLTEQNIAKLFAAAIVPGVLAVLTYGAVIALYVRLRPGAAGTAPRRPRAERLAALGAAWPAAAIFAAVVGGIYGGVFTPTEAAAVGALGTGLVALAAGRLDGPALREALLATAAATAMIYLIVLGAGFYNGFLALARVPQAISGFVTEAGLGPWAVLAIILGVYLVLGCVMDSLAMILLTVPIFWPVVAALDFGLTPEETALWFGVLVLVVVEVGLITPPVGLNLFVLSAMDPETPIGRTYAATLWFVAGDLARIALLVAFPALSLMLVR